MIGPSYVTTQPLLTDLAIRQQSSCPGLDLAIQAEQAELLPYIIKKGSDSNAITVR